MLVRSFRTVLQGAPEAARAAWRGRLAALLPGLALSAAVTLAAIALQAAEAEVFGRAWLESLVLAILIGALVRSLWRVTFGEGGAHAR